MHSISSLDDGSIRGAAALRILGDIWRRISLSALRARIGSLAEFDNFSELAMGRTFFRNTSLQVHRLRNIQMILDHNAADAGSLRTCLGERMYAPYLPQMSLPPELNVLDLGANVGGFPLLLATRMYIFKKLVCVEFNPNTFVRLQFNIFYNFGDIAEVLNAAVCAKNRPIYVELGQGSTCDDIYRGTDSTATTFATRKPCEIQGRSLDSVIEQTFASGEIIDICKMDVEGAEDEIFCDPSSENSTFRRIRYLIMEIHTPETYQDLMAMIRDRGFELLDVDYFSPQKNVGVHFFANSSLSRMNAESHGEP